MPTTTSGFFLQRISADEGARDLVLPAIDGSGGVDHYTREDTAAGWRRGAVFARELGVVAWASLIQSNFGEPGNLEVVARIGDRLAAFWCAPGRELVWSGPIFFASGAAGDPALIQSNLGGRGQFDLVVPHAGGGIAHYRRDNDSAGLPWVGPTVLGEGRVEAVAMLQGDGAPGELEVAARVGDRLLFFRRSGHDLTWHGPMEGVSGVAGTPALLLQGSLSDRGGSLELVAPLAGVGLGHWSREGAASAPFRGPDVFATDLGRCEAVSLLRVRGASAGLMELAVRAQDEVVHLAHDGRAWSRRATVCAAPRPSSTVAPQPLPAPVRAGGAAPKLRPGPHRAGFRRLGGIALSPDAFYSSTWPFEGTIYRAPRRAAGLLYYPASADGEEAPLCPGGPFPVVALAHERRLRRSPVCLGAPTDLDQDYRQLAGVMAYLARWGFVVVAPDLSWLAPDPEPTRRAAVLRDALAQLRAGSRGPLLADFERVGLIGHGAGAHACLALAGDASSPFQARALALIAPLPGGEERLSTLSGLPLMIMRGTADTGTAGAGEAPAFLYERAAAPKHLVTIAGANHLGYTTSLCLAAPLDTEGTLPRREQQAIAMGYIAAFFSHYLRGAQDEGAVLSGEARLQGLTHLDLTVQAARHA